MSETATAHAAKQWDELYRDGRYHGDEPVPFVNTILENLDDDDRKGYGMYIGCGNGRNYLPLFSALGTNLRGIDISEEGIRQIHEREPATIDSAHVRNFANYAGASVFRYIVSIQVFQHGDRSSAEDYFQRSAEALQPGGKLFLRVNSSSPNLIYRHQVIEGNKATGKTVLYEDGPKKGQQIHYYSKPELTDMAKRHGFSIIRPLVEVTEKRRPPLRGHWAQWETIWQKGQP
jgi:predicted TPR repeat methyltransferase